LKPASEGVATIQRSITDAGSQTPLNKWCQTAAELELIIDMDELIDTLAYQVILQHIQLKHSITGQLLQLQNAKKLATAKTNTKQQTLRKLVKVLV